MTHDSRRADGATSSHRRTGRAIELASFANGATEPLAGVNSPTIERTVHAGSDLTFSLAWFGWPVGMLAASLVSGWMMARAGARNLFVAGALVYWSGFALIGWADTPWLLFLVTLTTGIGNGMFDTAWARLAPWYAERDRELRGPRTGLKIQLQNAFFSSGSIVATVVAIALAAAHVRLEWSLAALSVIALVITIGWGQSHLPDLQPPMAAQPRAGEDAVWPPVRRGRSRPPRQLRGAGMLAFCAALPVGVAYVWAALYLSRLGLAGDQVQFGALAFTVLECLTRLGVGVAAGRLTWLNEPVRLALCSGVTGLLGVAAIVTTGTVAGAIAGFALIGAGTALLGPMVQEAAPRLWPTEPDRAAALVTRYSYGALALGPVIVGPVSSALGTTATASSLRWTFSVIAVLFVLVLALARTVRTSDAATDASSAAAE